jgi:hypothetical protein
LKIALHHGAVHSAKTDIGYEISNEHVTTDLFSGHDMTLLGDIHKPAQFLTETIAYPGSLNTTKSWRSIRSWNTCLGCRNM